MQRFSRWASVGLGCYPLSRNMCERNWWEQFDMTQKKESSEWREPKSSVFDYFDRLIIQGKKRSSWWQHCALRRRLHRGPRAALRWPQTQSQKKNPSRRCGCGCDWGWTAGLLCKHWQWLSAVLHLQSHHWQLFTGVTDCKRSPNICKCSASTGAACTQAWWRQWERRPDPWNGFNPHAWLRTERATFKSSPVSQERLIVVC